jgi:hypothetical protein
MDQVLADAKQQSLAGRDVAELVNRVAVQHKDVDTYAEAEEVQQRSSSHRRQSTLACLGTGTIGSR